MSTGISQTLSLIVSKFKKSLIRIFLRTQFFYFFKRGPYRHVYQLNLKLFGASLKSSQIRKRNCKSNFLYSLRPSYNNTVLKFLETKLDMVLKQMLSRAFWFDLDKETSEARFLHLHTYFKCNLTNQQYLRNYFLMFNTIGMHTQIHSELPILAFGISCAFTERSTTGCHLLYHTCYHTFTEILRHLYQLLFSTQLHKCY